MSTFADKKDAVTAFLINRAQLTRVTNHQELQRVTGSLLYNGGRRSTPAPVSRESIAEVLAAVDAEFASTAGLLPSVLVEHFFDRGITPRFYEHAIECGLLSEDSSPEAREDFRSKMLAKVYLAYAAQTPDDLSTLFPQPESGYDEDYEDLDEDADEDVDA